MASLLPTLTSSAGGGAHVYHVLPHLGALHPLLPLPDTPFPPSLLVACCKSSESWLNQHLLAEATADGPPPPPVPFGTPCVPLTEGDV